MASIKIELRNLQRRFSALLRIVLLCCTWQGITDSMFNFTLKMELYVPRKIGTHL